MLVTLHEIGKAQARIKGVVVRTKLVQSELGGNGARHEALFLKPENQQPIGAFKLRGAYNKIASLSEEERSRGVIT
ncbi:MAG TPA: threonine/serine dehydratase, partial [Terriglobales bacterium]